MTLTQIKPAGLSKPVDLADNEKLRLGTGNDLQIYHDGTRSWLANATGGLRLSVAGGSNRVDINKGTVDEHMARFQADGAVELYYDNSKKFETTSYGNLSAGQVRVSASNASTVAFSVGDVGTGFYNSGSNAIGYAANGTQKWNINSAGDLNLADSVNLYLGDGNDLRLYHDSSNSVITNSTGYLVISTGATESIYLQGQRVMGQPSGGGDVYFVGNKDGNFEAYYDNSKKFETASYGVSTDGLMNFNGTGDKILIPDAGKIAFGGGGDLKIYHDGSHSYIYESGTGKLRVITNSFRLLETDNSTPMISADENSAVELYHDGTKKLMTTTTGIDINTGGSDGGSSIKIYGHDAIKRNNWGYSTAYRGIQIGRSDSNINSSIFMGVDPSSNTSGAFGGYGNEMIFRNDLAFYHPNNANNNWKTFMRTGQFADTGAVQFPNGLGFGSDTSTNNILDDYEEGTWTPINVNFQTYSSVTWDATYTKIGRIVICNACQTGGTTNWGTGQQIRGLPFSVEKTGCGNWTNNAPSDGGELLVWDNEYLYFSQGRGNVSSGHKLRITFMYQTTA